MADFSGYLLLVDLDDTFRGKDGTVEKHSQAIRYFTENGGKFSFATGRAAAYVKEQSFFDLINAPACLYNGALVYDYATDTVLRQVHVDFSVEQLAQMLAQGQYHEYKLYLPMDEKGMILSAPTKEILGYDRDVLQLHPLKCVVIFENEAHAVAFMEAAKELALLQTSYISRSWKVGVEITAGNATKGCALDFIRSYLGGIHTTVGAGNYENDIPLLQHGDLGVAVGNALDSVKAVADIVVAPCDEFGLCQLVERLEFLTNTGKSDIVKYISRGGDLP